MLPWFLPCNNLLLLSCSVVSDSLRFHGLQHSRLPHPKLYPGLWSHVQWISDTLQLSHPLLPSSPPAFNLFQNLSLFRWIRSTIKWPKFWSFSFNINTSNEYSGLISLKDWLVWFPWSSRDSQEFSPTPQMKNIIFSALSLLYGPPLTSVWLLEKNSFD